MKDDGNGIPQEIRDILEEKPAMGGPGAAEGGKSLAGQPGNPKGQSGNPSGQPHIMGLRIVKQIINAHGGRMEFSGDGREVILLLPVTGTLEAEKKKVGGKQDKNVRKKLSFHGRSFFANPL